MFAVLFIFIVTIILLSLWRLRRPENLPPGEWGLPIVGYAPFMDWKISNSLGKLQKKHGNIFTVKIGSITCVVISDFAVIKSAFQKSEFCGRPYIYQHEVLKKYLCHKAIVHSNGKVWETSRRFGVRTLREFGLGKASILDEIISNEVHSFVQNLTQRVNKPIEIEWNVNVAIFNIIWKLVANKNYNISDKEVQKFPKDIKNNFDDCEGRLAIFTVFPWLLPLVPNFVKNRWMNLAAVEKRRDETLLSFKNIIEEHKKNLDPKNPKDFIDKYLIELEEQRNNPDYHYWGDEDLLTNIHDFFIAGSETTASTIRWFILYMAKYRDVQKSIQKEIDENVPKGQQISLQDKDRLPLLEASSFETNRNVSFLPTSLPHEATENTVLEGYNIPKGTWILPDITFCHRNPKYWKHPNEFSLENFLDEDGKVLRNKEGYLPFSLGKRLCLGDSLAKMELFLFEGAILQNFDISEPVGQDVQLEPDPNVNVFNYPPNFKVVLKNRN